MNEDDHFKAGMAFSDTILAIMRKLKVFNEAELAQEIKRNRYATTFHHAMEIAQSKIEQLSVYLEYKNKKYYIRPSEPILTRDENMEMLRNLTKLT